MGYVGWINTYEGSSNPERVQNVNSQLVSALLDLGAVLFCKVTTDSLPPPDMLEVLN
jgi:amidase